MDGYLELLALLTALFFLPKILQRVRLPGPVSELALGAVLGPAALGWVAPSDSLEGLAGFGITALFLFAGLEVDLEDLLLRRRTLMIHLAIQGVLIAAAAWCGSTLGLELGPAVLVAAGIMAPSVGYILTAIDTHRPDAELATWIKQKAIAGEMMAILVVLVFANTGSLRDLGIGLGTIASLVVAVPLLVLVFHHGILPFAPKTEFSFLLIVALLAAYVSHHVGMHYLAGAFLVGLVARRYLDWMVREGIETSGLDQALTAFRFFAGFFVPFFFLLVGLKLSPEAFTRESLAIAATLFLIAVPLRVIPTFVHRRVGLREGWREATLVGLFLMPTTVFTLAVAELLRTRFGIDDTVYGGLVIYAAATSLLPVLAPTSASAARPEVG